MADYFETEAERETAYAAVYFTSGLAGAMGYLFSKFMDRTTFASINTVAPLVALVCYHFSFMDSPEQEMLRRRRQAVSLQDSVTNDDDNDRRVKDDNAFVTMNVLQGSPMTIDDDEAETATVTFSHGI